MRNCPKICDQNVLQLFYRVRCWDTFIVLRNSPKVTTTSIMASLYTPPIRTLCFSFESTDNYSKDLSSKQKFKNLSVSLARRHQKKKKKSCNWFTSIVCKWKKVQCHKLMEDNETVEMKWNEMKWKTFFQRK